MWCSAICCRIFLFTIILKNKEYICLPLVELTDKKENFTQEQFFSEPNSLSAYFIQKGKKWLLIKR